MLQEQQANIQMSAQAEMQKAQQKFEFEMQKEQMKEANDNSQNDKDRQVQLAQMLMNLLSQKQNKGEEKIQEPSNEAISEQSVENTNIMNSESANNSENVSSEQELMKIIEYIMSLPPEEQQALLEQYPELVQVMSLIQGTPTM